MTNLEKKTEAIQSENEIARAVKKNRMAQRICRRIKKKKSDFTEK